MATALSTRQSLLTRAVNRLGAVVKDCADWETMTFEFPLEHEQKRAYIALQHQRLQKYKTHLESELSNVDRALDQYSSTADKLDPNTPAIAEILQKVSTNVETTTQLIDRAYSILTTIETLRQELVNNENRNAEFGSHHSPDVPPMSLAPIPIPKFTGRIWEWDTFWGAFEHSVHSRQIDDLYKLNYLLDALQGEAKETVKQYEISRSTYPLVVEHLKRKYGDAQALVDQMIHRLQNLRAQSDRLEDQEKLCEQLSSIVAQLQLKGENVNNVFLQKQLLGKFTEDIQRQVLRKKEQESPESCWDTIEMLATAKRYISLELKVIGRINKKKEQQPQTQFPKERRDPTKGSQTALKRRECFYCERQDHSPKECERASTREERLEILRKRKLCHNCGSKDHTVSNCKGGPCRLCKTHGHHTSICRQLFPQMKQPTGQDAKTTPQTQSKTSSKRSRTTIASKVNTISSEKRQAQDGVPSEAVYVNHHRIGNNVHILVGQAQVSNPKDQALETVHVMLDTGADRSFISNQLADRLRLPDLKSVELTINTFGSQQPLKKTCAITELQIWDIHGTAHMITATKIDTVTEPMLRSRLSHEDKQFLHDHNMSLSINANVRDISPQVLLGCGELYSFLDKGLLAETTLPSGLRLIPSRLGYLVSGKDSNCADTFTDQQEVLEFENNSMESQDEPQSWADFCTFESTGVHEFTGPSNEERKVMDAKVWEEFQRTIEKKPDGYHVRLPWKDEARELPDNRVIAVRRLEAAILKLANNPELLQQYHETIVSQHENGIIEEVDESAPPTGPVIHYLAHRAVITPNKETTKLRVVFDASAHLKGQTSLNDVLYQGPVILPKICDILMRFRTGKVALVSDVEKAFLQIRLQHRDRDATRFLWLRDIAQPFSSANTIVYRFTRVTFGLNCSPFLLAGTIKHHLNTCVADPEFIREITDNIYVDNLITTVSSKEEGFHFYKDAKRLFQDLNMNLREFRSNDDELNREIATTDLSQNSLQKVLGIQWRSQEDQLVLVCRYRNKPKATKRTISEQIASVYDPLGLLTPLTLKGKQFLQHLWKCEYDWDTLLSAEHQLRWETIAKETDGFQITLPRQIAQITSPSTLVLFADASNSGMAACAYLVSKHGSHLLTGKSKLPSLRDSPTVPKLELNALTMATRLLHTIYNAVRHRVRIENSIVLSDSEIALSWLTSTSRERSTGVLVRNRVAEIMRIVRDLAITVRFGYVKTSQNPADCATRGVTKDEFSDHIWWHGPKFIIEDPDTWPEECRLFTLPTQDQEKQTCTVTSATEVKSELLDWTRHNRLTSAKHTLAYALRFLHNLSTKVNRELRIRLEHTIPELCSMKTESFITASENELALQILVRHHQKAHYTTEQLKSLKQLNLRRDNNGIWRCQGRLGGAHIKFDAKYPMLIAPKTDLAKAIICDAHLPYHCSTAQTIANVRQHFWIPKLRQMVKQTLRSCIPCQKLNNLPFKYPEMDDLPNKRVQRTRPFEHVGIDYFGPLPAKQNESTLKVYGIIITCAVTRLLHLELVPDMSTNQLLHALRRFFARRGVPSSITSDNGPSFLLGEQILRQAVLPVINDTVLATVMATKGIAWKTVTPYAPWQGALYERLIKSVKHSLYKVLQQKVVSPEELHTLLTEIEGSLNSRPLTYQEERWEDSPTLRPIDFIQRDMIVTYPFEALDENGDDDTYLPYEEAAQLRTRKQAEEALKTSHKLTERFWSIWNQHYLSSLREAHKLTIDNKRGTSSTPEIDMVVLVSDPVAPRNSWKLGRIVAIPQSDSGKIREVQVKLSNGRLIRRPVNLLVPLELGETWSEPGNPKKHTSQSDDTLGEVPEESERTHRYNLRHLKPVNYAESNAIFSFVNTSTTRKGISLSSLLACLTTLVLLPGIGSAATEGQLSCIAGGVAITTHNIDRYELCTDHYCHMKDKPLESENVFFPPEILLYEHHVQLKLFDGQNLSVIETLCPPESFCENIRCWFCTANMFNPECSPRTAIMAMAIVLYVVIAIIYALCFVPMVIGKPCRIVSKAGWSMIKSLGRLLYKICSKWHIFHRRRYDVEALLRAPLLAVLYMAALAHNPLACQDIDVFFYHNSVCTFSEKGAKRCTLESTEVMKLNSFNQEACIRLTKHQSMEKEIRIQWRKLQLTCVKRTITFTRNILQKVVDSKRCAHVGSCIGDKCASVNESSLLPELDQGNQYPGITKCVESCGGIGCGCLALSSGCLFYRIFYVPKDEKIYEIFGCSQWKEEVELEITTIGKSSDSVKKRIVILQPTVPLRMFGMRITLTSLTFPPTPTLSSHFITDGSQVALWNRKGKPHLLCESSRNAMMLNCSIASDCNCEPAENKINCACTDSNITNVFLKEIENRLPIKRPWITFTTAKQDPTVVVARIPSLVMAELLINLKEVFEKSVKKVTDSICTIPNSIAKGCYQCPQGATAQITCTTDGNFTMATIVCEKESFTVPCQKKGAISNLRFSHRLARVKKICKVSCGTNETIFEITGILQWVRTIHSSARKIINGESNVYNELVFPDFGHIVDVIVHWYKSIVVAVAVMIGALAAGYLFLWTCGLAFFWRLIKVPLKGTKVLFCMVTRATATLWMTIILPTFRQTHKRLEKQL